MMKKILLASCVLFAATAAVQAATADLSGTPWTGYMGGGDPSALLVESSGGELTMASQGTRWSPTYDDDPEFDYGPYLFTEITGDFVASTRVTGFAGAVDAQVFHNYGGIQARTPGGELIDNEDIMQTAYFPTWVGHIAWSQDDNVRTETGQTGAIWAGEDTYALAASYPYLQLERSGNDFHYRISQDGAVWIPLTDEYGLTEGNPVVITRDDMPATLQLGLMHGIDSLDPGGFIKYDSFGITQGGSTVFSDDFSVDHTYIPEPATMLLLGLGAFVIRRRK